MSSYRAATYELGDQGQWLSSSLARHLHPSNGDEVPKVQSWCEGAEKNNVNIPSLIHTLGCLRAWDPLLTGTGNDQGNEYFSSGEGERRWDWGAIAPRRCLLSEKEKAVASQENTFSSILEASLPNSPRQPLLCSGRAAAVVTGPPPHASLSHFSQISL